MSDTITHLFSFTSIAHNSIMASIDTVGEIVSSLLVYILWGLLSGHSLAFIVLSLLVPSFFLHMTFHVCFMA